jgi:hypothetical protein
MSQIVRNFILRPPAEVWPLYGAVFAAFGAMGYFGHKVLTEETRGVDFKMSTNNRWVAQPRVVQSDV